eukprot:CAMPEP_0177584076 /NCGR_PEP_ID=MMETSP0419_2-20121207/3691_1 /TAXON_ID=582737 /ORGANISM="Tetraselmis sp., Strain GSL018" /LENGTH=237 /DNA_ID=CAMNT_0019073567 /DNA_START=35 /DNA_END=744 /DNA_ORIENTATION=+
MTQLMPSNLLRLSKSLSSGGVLLYRTGNRSHENSARTPWLWFLHHLSERSFSSFPPYTELTFPSLSPTMTHGNLSKWHKKEGEEVGPGEPLADIETDKATMVFENQDEGFIAKILVPEGARDVEVGTPVALLVDDAESVPKFASFVAGAKAGSAAGSEAAGSTGDPQPAKSGGGAEADLGDLAWSDRLGPAARSILASAGVPPSGVTGTGPRGVVTKWDALQAIAASAAGREAEPAG